MYCIFSFIFSIHELHYLLEKLARSAVLRAILKNWKNHALLYRSHIAHNCDGNLQTNSKGKKFTFSIRNE